LLDSDDGTILTLGVMLGKAAGSVDTDGPILGSIKGFMLFDASTLGCPLGERETEGDALASTFGDFDVEENTLGLMDGFMLLLGKILAMLVIVGSNNNDGPKLYPGDGPILVVRKSVGLDDGAMLKLGAILGKAAGSIDTDGPTLGSNEGFMLFDGSTLGCSLGEKEMDGDAVDTTQISSHVTSNIKWHCFAKLLEGKEQSGEAPSDISEPSSRFIDVSYNQRLISATRGRICFCIGATYKILRVYACFVATFMEMCCKFLNYISTSNPAAATLPCLLNCELDVSVISRYNPYG